jgi:hypothetical protein
MCFLEVLTTASTRRKPRRLSKQAASWEEAEYRRLQGRVSTRHYRFNERGAVIECEPDDDGAIKAVRQSYEDRRVFVSVNGRVVVVYYPSYSSSCSSASAASCSS